MKLQLPPSWRLSTQFALLAAVLFFTLAASGEPLPLERAVRLALSHSTAAAIAHADVQRAIASYRELRDNRIPQLAAGSGLGYSYGFPLAIEGSAPSLVTVVAQSSLLNFAQNQYLGAARADIRAADLQDKDQRIAVILDVVISYAELARWETRLTRLEQDDAQARQMERAVSARLQEGVDTSVDLNKAKLVSARIRFHRSEARGSADVLRHHLSDLTGIPVSAIEIDPASIPALPPASRAESDSGEKALSSSFTVQIAQEHSLALSMRAAAEHRAMLPSLDFSAQYARLSSINNYNIYYQKFQPDNATIGVAIRLPIFNASQRARAEAADFDALKAKKQVEATRDKVSEETLKLQRSAEEMDAARDVARLEYELAQSALEAARTRNQTNVGTMHELADAQVQASERYLLYQDADFEYQRARLALLRATGELEPWVLPPAPSK